MGPRGGGTYAVVVSRAILRPWTQQSTWWSVVHLMCGLFVGYLVTVFVFVLTVTTLSTLIVLPVAIVISWIGFLITHGLARLERTRYLALLDADLTDPNAIRWPPIRPDTDTGQSGPARLWSRYKARLGSGSRWREVLYLLLRLPVAAVETFLMTLLWPGSVVLVTLPLFASRLPEGSADFGLFSISPGWSAWLASLVGLASLVYLAPWGTFALAQADVAFGRSLLAHGSRSEIEQAVDRLETSRAAAIDGAEAERRRIERDLHDGAQQRLIAAAMDLGVAQERLVTDLPAGLELVRNAHGEVKAAMHELRDLVRGIHPVILEDRGLDAALSAAVARVGVPVDMRVDVEPRPSPTVESAAYFIVCEALTNITRHSRATRAKVEISRQPRSVHITVSDDGIGGADPARGTGIAGLSERAAALGGKFSLASPSGGPTTMEVELPCE